MNKFADSVGFEILTAMTMNSIILWDMLPYSPTETY
jgi:hypothetical protein